MHASGQDSGLRGSFIREIDISGIFAGETFTQIYRAFYGKDHVGVHPSGTNVS